MTLPPCPVSGDLEEATGAMADLPASLSGSQDLSGTLDLPFETLN
jgi:hypothetical protein